MRVVGTDWSLVLVFENLVMEEFWFENISYERKNPLYVIQEEHDYPLQSLPNTFLPRACKHLNKMPN
jgi:hypothetical protein